MKKWKDALRWILQEITPIRHDRHQFNVANMSSEHTPTPFSTSSIHSIM
jgi:hypothetical protein